MNFRQIVKNFYRKVFNSVARGAKEASNPYSDPNNVVLKTKGKEITNRGTVVAAGLESDLINPDTLLNDKNKGLEIYDRMLIDDRIKFAAELKKALILSVDWDIVSASEKKEDEERAALCIRNFEELKEPTFEGCNSNLLDSMFFGYKIGEIIWRISDDAKYLWEKVKFQHSMLYDFEYDAGGNLDKVLYGYNYGEDTEIPRKKFEEKFLYMIYPYLKDGNWYGDSELREIYFEWWSKYNIKRWRNVYLQNYGMPVPIVVYDYIKTTATEKNELIDTFETWQDKMYMLIPGLTDAASGEIIPKFKVEWRDIETKGGTSQYDDAIAEIDKAITRKMLLPDRLGFTEDLSGSFAQSKKIFDIMVIGIRQIHRRMEEVYDKKIRQLVDLNFPNTEQYPKFKFNEIDKGIESQMLQILLDKGVVDKREKWIRSYVNVPQISPEEQKEIDKAKEEAAANMPFNPAVPQPQGSDTDDTKPGEIAPKKDEPEEDGIKQKINFKKEIENPKQIEAQYDRAEADFVNDYESIHKSLSDYIIKYVKKNNIVENKDLGGLNDFKLRKKDLSELDKLFWSNFSRMYLTGKGDAANAIKDRLPKEMKSYEMQISDDELKWLDRTWVDSYLQRYGELGILTKEDKNYLKGIKDRAFTLTGEQDDRIVKLASNTVYNGIRSGWTTGQVSAKLQEILSEDRKKYSTTIARTNASDSYNVGRMNLFTNDDVEGFVEAYMYNAIIDSQTTPFCQSHDGQIIKASDPDFSTIVPPNHFNAVVKGTKIRTVKGDKNIEDVNIGDYVLTNTGTYKKVYDTMKEYRNEDIYEIELDDGKKILITGDHPIFTKGKWKDAKDIRINDSIRIRGNKITRFCKHCGNEILLKGKKKNQHYCNQKCMAEDYRKHEFICLRCGKELIGSWKGKKTVYKGRRFCSRECYLKYKGRSSLEEKVANVLDEMNIKYMEQVKIGRYTIDFYLPVYNLIIEADGNYWHTIKEKWNVRNFKDGLFKSLNFNVCHISQDTILNYKFKNELKELLNGLSESNVNKESSIQRYCI